MTISTYVEWYTKSGVPKFTFMIDQVFSQAEKEASADYMIDEVDTDMRSMRSAYVLSNMGAVYWYQSVTKDNRGNPNYAFGKFPGGFSSRVDVINDLYDKTLVTMDNPGYALDLYIALDCIKEGFQDLYVLCWTEYPSLHEVRYCLMPWAFDNRDERIKVPENLQEHAPLLLNTNNPQFVMSAYAHMTSDIAEEEK